MSSLKRKYKVDEGKNAKMKFTCDSFHEEFLKKLEKFKTTDDCKVQKIFEEHAIRNTDKKTLQNLNKFTSKSDLEETRPSSFKQRRYCNFM